MDERDNMMEMYRVAFGVKGENGLVAAFALPSEAFAYAAGRPGLRVVFVPTGEFVVDVDDALSAVTRRLNAYYTAVGLEPTSRAH